MREAIGGSLRRARTARRRTLREVSRRARVSLGYLSEVERGRTEASSALLASICAALAVS
ncbi:MAG: helix-turn-helix transcriptional regulator, partial [Pseudonocardia sp.]|nr:helix-turn-helix transcriptional regulator [Pseudonocardia sp.]